MSLRRLLARLASALLTVVAAVSLAFVLHHALPADPARAIAGPQARPADVARIRAQLGIDRPLAVQYALFARRLVHLASRPDPEAHASCAALGPVHVDLGTSYQKRRSVASLLAERFPRTLLLALGATLVQVCLGVVVGVAMAVRRRTAWDALATLATLVGISAPTFVVGLVLQYALAYRLRWLPLDGFGRTAAEHAACLVLPSLTLGLYGAAYAARLVRDEMTTELTQDYARTARAKGASAVAVVVRHALRNALVPLVTAVGLDFGALVGGAIVTEKLFRWPGLGQLSVEAVFDRDTPVVLGTVIVSAAAIVLANLATDLSYAWLDPRVRDDR